MTVDGDATVVRQKVNRPGTKFTTFRVDEMQAEISTSRLYRSCGIVARLGLILSLWQAPVPWLHNHGTNITEISSPLLASEFCEHLLLFHGGNELNSDEEFGWHCHWILPSWIHFADEASGVSGQKTDDVTRFDSVIPIPVTSGPVEVLALAATPIMGIVCRMDSFERWGRNFHRLEDPFTNPSRFAVMR